MSVRKHDFGRQQARVFDDADDEYDFSGSSSFVFQVPIVPCTGSMLPENSISGLRRDVSAGSGR